MNPEERSRLLDALLEGDISESDFLRIEAEMIVDPEVRREYYRRLQLGLLLEREASEAPAEPNAVAVDAHENNASERKTTLNRFGFWTGVLVAFAASLLIAASFIPTLLKLKAAADSEIATNPKNESAEPSASGFAVLSGQSNAVWKSDSGDAVFENGSLLPEGELHLKSGLVHLELFSGVQMVIQGDAIFSVDSPMQVTMASGIARAHVPEPAQGFRVKTLTGEIVDLGTEFTIDVDADRSSVKVVEGEIELHQKGSDVRSLRDGQTLQMTRNGVAEPTDAKFAIVSPTEFQNELAKRQIEQLQRFEDASDRLQNDPRLVAYYRVDPNEGRSRQLKNFASAANVIAGEGAVVAADRTNDRWGRQNAALDFSPMGSRVRVEVPGEHRGVTLLCWVKINSLDRWYNSLFLTDGHEDREPHWQIMDDGRLFFSVKSPSDSERTENQHIFYSKPFWNSSLSGRWIMLATVYDVDQKQVSHYVNSEQISREEIATEWLVESVTIGPASICNWSEPMYRVDSKFVVRNLNGSLDEFALFSGALTTEEIKAHFHAGNPNEQ